MPSKLTPATRTPNSATPPASPHCTTEQPAAREESIWCDRYIGTKAALIAAGIAADGQFPGDPGRGLSSCGYYEDGEPCRRGRPQKAWLRIQRRGKQKFEAQVLVDADERRRRAATQALADAREKALAHAREKGRADAASLAALAEDMVVQWVAKVDSPAMLHVGDPVVTDDGEEAVITMGYKCLRVEGDGPRAGYVVRLEGSGEEYFYAAHRLRDRADKRPRYLRLVG